MRAVRAWLLASLGWTLGCSASLATQAPDLAPAAVARSPESSEPGRAPSAAAADTYAESAVTKVQARLHQLRSSAKRPFSLFAYDVPTPHAVPHIIAIDEKDRVWVTESGGRFARNFIDVPAVNKVARLDQGGTITEWTTGTEGSSPMGILFGPDGDMWVAERLANRVSRRSADGTRLVRYDIPTPDAWPTAIVLDSQGNGWVTETMADKLARIDAKTGQVTEIPLPATKTKSTGIAVDKQDRVWVAMRDVGTLGRYDPRTGTFDQFKLPTADAKPCGLVVDGAGQVWFSMRNAGKIGLIHEDGSIQEFATDNRHGGPFFLAADKRGDIWFSELFSNRVGRFEPKTRTFEYFELPGKDAFPAGIALDSKGNLWFAQQGSNVVGVIVRTDLSYLAGETPGAGPGGKIVNARHEFVELEVPTPQSVPGIVAVDARDTVWFTQMGGGWVSPGFPPGPGGSAIGYYKDGALHELKTPTPESGPTSMSLDPCGDDVWVTLRTANKIARIRDFQITEYAIPLPGALPVGIAVDLDHNVWVALSDANKLARMTPEGEWRFLDMPNPKAEPRTIFVDSANEVWFAQKTGNRIGHLDKDRWTVETWELPTRLGWPLSLMEDADGNIWFAEMRSDKLGMFDRKTKKITEYALPVQSAPFKVNYDKASNAIWVSTVFYNAILRFDLAKKQVVSIYKIPAEGAWMGGLDRDSQGCLWFSEQFANKLGRLCIEGVSGVTLGPGATPGTGASAGR